MAEKLQSVSIALKCIFIPWLVLTLQLQQTTLYLFIYLFIILFFHRKQVFTVHVNRLL